MLSSIDSIYDILSQKYNRKYMLTFSLFFLIPQKVSNIIKADTFFTICARIKDFCIEKYQNKDLELNVFMNITMQKYIASTLM